MFLFKRWKHGYSRTPTYNSWQNMIARCTNPNANEYNNYGGRGIAVCNEWMDFSRFLRDMGEKPKGCSIERKNNNKGYNPENCIWASKKEQANNRRSNILIQINGAKYTVAQFAEKFHLNAKQLYEKLQRARDKMKRNDNPNQTTLF